VYTGLSVLSGSEVSVGVSSMKLGAGLKQCVCITAVWLWVLVRSSVKCFPHARRRNLFGICGLMSKTSYYLLNALPAVLELLFTDRESNVQLRSPCPRTLPRDQGTRGRNATHHSCILLYDHLTAFWLAAEQALQLFSPRSVSYPDHHRY
jgi:hypothetical protein